MGWWTLGLGCLWDWTQNLLAAKYLLRSWLGRLLLLAYWAAWAGLGWWAFHGLAWYWALAGAGALYLTGNIASGIYSLKELALSKTYQAASGWLAQHPRLKALRARLMPQKYPPRVPD
jgi:hypothetical protein